MTTPAPILPKGVFAWLAARPLLSAAGAGTGLLIALFTFFTPFYETSDDVTSNLFVAGQMYTDQPDEHLLFTNVLIGLPLASLYRLFPNVPWYGGYLVAVIILALTVIWYVLLKINPVGKQLFLALGFLVVVGFPSLIWLQFTRVGSLAVLAGLLLYLLAVQAQFRGLAIWICGSLLVILGGLIRSDCVWLMGVVLSPALGVALIQAKPGMRWKFALVLSSTLLVVKGLDVYNGWYYSRQEGWRDFYEFNALRAQFTDYFRVDYNARTHSVLETVGWSKVDLMMLYAWNFADPERFSAAKMRRVLAQVAAEDRARGPRSWNFLAGKMLADTSLLGLLLFGLASLVLLGSWPKRIIPGVCLLCTFAVCLFLHQYYHLPPRVYFSAFAGVVAVILVGSSGKLSFSELRPTTGAGALRGAAVVLASGVLIWQVLFLRNANAEVGIKRAQTLAFLERLAPRSDQLFILWPNEPFQEYLILPFGDLSLVRDFTVIEMGTHVQTPIVGRRLDQFAIRDLYFALCNRPETFLIGDEAGNRLLAAYLAEHYGIRLGAREILAHRLLNYHVYTFIDLNKKLKRR